MENILLFIFWFIVGLYALQLAIRYLLPWLITRSIRKMSERMQQRQAPYENNARNDDDLRVKKPNKQNPIIDPDIGEYVDFEEIKENKSSNSNE